MHTESTRQRRSAISPPDAPGTPTTPAAPVPPAAPARRWTYAAPTAALLRAEPNRTLDRALGASAALVAAGLIAGLLMLSSRSTAQSAAPAVERARGPAAQAPIADVPGRSVDSAPTPPSAPAP